MDQLAQRYHIDPRDLDTDDDSIWLQRSLEFMRMEASVKVTGGPPSEGTPASNSPSAHTAEGTKRG